MDSITAVTNTAVITYYYDDYDEENYTAGGNGGAIYIEVGDDSDVTIAQGSFEHNQVLCDSDETAQTNVNDRCRARWRSLLVFKFG